MNKKNRKYPSNSRQSGSDRRWTVLVITFIVALYGAIAYVYYHREDTHILSTITACKTKWAGWVASKSVPKVAPPVAVKNVVASKEVTAPAVHFEFYDALPNMKIAGDKLLAQQKPKTLIADPNELETELALAARKK